MGSTTSTAATPIYINFPVGMHIGSDDTLYVCDSRNNRIQRYRIGNSTGTTVAGQTSGSSGTNLNRLTYPNDVDVDSNGNIYVVDTYNNRVMKWTSNAVTGARVAGNGSLFGSSRVFSRTRHILFVF